MPAIADRYSYMQAVSQYPVLTPEQEHELAVEYRQTESRDAAWALVCSHLRQVVAIARGYSGYGLPEMDLIQEGNIGLMKAVKKFDPDRKVRLSTYATYWIKAAINEFVLRNWRIVKVATTSAQRKLFFNLRRMTKQLGRRLSIKDAEGISDELEVPVKDVLEMEKRMTLSTVPFEADHTLDDDAFDKSPSATMAMDDGEHAELIVVDEDDKDNKLSLLHEALDALPERERLIIEERSLSESGKDTKLHELAKRLDISTERVRQLERKALKKIEQYVRNNYEALAV